MNHGDFIWADLSTYSTTKSIEFYRSLFDWRISNNEGYHILTNSKFVICGLYETPPFFQKIKMPHFWMSYFQVESVSDVIQIAESLGGKVEISNIPFYNGNIALIRDPLGAGFTIYEGKDLQLGKYTLNQPILKTELHTSNFEKVKTFYSEIFNWEFEEIENSTHQILLKEQKLNIKIREIPNNLKGNFEYWVLTFQVAEIDKTKEQINRLGGNIIEIEENKILVSDNSNEAFFYIQAQETNNSNFS